MKKIAFYVNATKPSALEARSRLEARAQKCGMETVDADSSRPDAVIVLGGDGTMLSAVHRYPGVPLLGLNLGSLGYLAYVEEANFEDAIGALAEGRYRISHRTALKVCGVNALNDVVVSRGVSGRAIRLDFSVDGAGRIRPCDPFRLQRGWRTRHAVCGGWSRGRNTDRIDGVLACGGRTCSHAIIAVACGDPRVSARALIASACA